MKIFKKITKIIIFALAVFMLVSGCAFNNKNNTAFAEVDETPRQTATRYYFELAPGDYFQPYGYNAFFNNNVGFVSINFFIDNNRYSYATWYSTNNAQTSITGQPLLKLNNFDDGKNVVSAPFRVYLNEEILLKIDINNALLNRTSVSFGGNSYDYILSIDATYLTIYKELGYAEGFENGSAEGVKNKTVGLLTGVYNINLEFYANDVSGVVATVNNATKHYTPGGLSFAPYNEEYANVITSYQPEYPENFIDRCDVILSLDGVPLVETLTNDYQIQNFVLKYQTTLLNVARPSIALEFDFNGEFVPFSLGLAKGFVQDYLTISASDLTPYYDRAITGIKITYYDRDIFSFYEPNALFTIDNLSATKDLIYGADIGYGNGYANGYEEGKADGEQGAIDGGYDNAGIFAGAVAFLRLFFQLIGGFMERKIVGEITFGLIIIGIPATLMIVDLIISLVRKFLGKSGGGE